MATDRYQRQTVLPGFGPDGQAKLRAATVAIIGCGGLGGPAAVYLAGAGVGTLLLVDPDTVEQTNLHRQPFFDGADDRPKVEQLAAHIRRLNPEVRLKTLTARATGRNLHQLVTPATLVLDCTDDATTKHLLSDACHLLATPLVYAAAQGFGGYLALFPNQDGPAGIHLRDLYPEPDPSLPDCATTGVLPTAVGTVALLQANAALCYLLGLGEPPIDTLITFSALDNRQQRMQLRKTYEGAVTPPWEVPSPTRSELEVTSAEGMDAVFSMLSESREPELPEGVERLPQRDPFGYCKGRMEAGKRYAVYCNSGKLSLVLAGQLRGAGLEVFSLVNRRTVH